MIDIESLTVPKKKKVAKERQTTLRREEADTVSDTPKLARLQNAMGSQLGTAREYTSLVDMKMPLYLLDVFLRVI